MSNRRLFTECTYEIVLLNNKNTILIGIIFYSSIVNIVLIKKDLLFRKP